VLRDRGTEWRVARFGYKPRSVYHIFANPELQQRTKTMKHLLSGVAVVAALTISAPAWAQPYGAGSGAQADQPVNPRAPYDRPVPPGWSGQTARPAAAAPSAAMPPDTTSANPPMHRHARASHAAKGQAKTSKQYLATSSADALNQQELARIQSGAPPMPPAPGPAPSGRMSAPR
jgi:hypothetical protein